MELLLLLEHHCCRYAEVPVMTHWGVQVVLQATYFGAALPELPRLDLLPAALYQHTQRYYHQKSKAHDSPQLENL
jgi:hypothetical protein